jgi:hypothetical protein
MRAWPIQSASHFFAIDVRLSSIDYLNDREYIPLLPRKISWKDGGKFRGIWFSWMRDWNYLNEGENTNAKPIAGEINSV